MKYIITLIFMFGLIACEKDESEKIPKLLDPSPKVKKIINHVPEEISGFENGKDILTVKYDQENISDLITTFKSDSISDLLDSTHFYYTNELLDSAFRISKQYVYRTSTGVPFSYYDTAIIKMIRNEDNLISQVDISHTHFESVQYIFSYNDENNIICIKNSGRVDSIFYNDDLVNEAIIYTTDPVHSNNPPTYSVIRHNSRPNPYYLIFQKLGYPHLFLFGSLATDQLMKYCISEYNFKNNLNDIRHYYEFTYNCDGLVVSKYRKGDKENKTIYEYY